MRNQKKDIHHKDWPSIRLKREREREGGRERGRERERKRQRGREREREREYCERICDRRTNEKKEWAPTTFSLHRGEVFILKYRTGRMPIYLIVTLLSLTHTLTHSLFLPFFPLNYSLFSRH